MSRARIASLLVFATALSATGIAAESATLPPSPVLPTPPVEASPSLSATPRAVSPETAAKLKASVPLFVAAPVTGVTLVTATAAAPLDPGNEVKPKNTIIRLPEYIVRDPKIPAIKEREVLTRKARLELARQQHPGSVIGNFFGLNNGITLAMLAEQERLDRKREFDDLATLARYSDPASAAKVKHEVEQAFMRERDFGR
jgi:hypothetical protein